MALPTTITGISTVVSCVGPFKSTLIPTDSYDVDQTATVDSSLRPYWSTVFKTGAIAGNCSAITVTLSKIGAPVGNIVAELRTVSGSPATPTTTILGSSSGVSSGGIVGTGIYVGFTFATAVNLSPNTYYCLVLNFSALTTNNSTNHILWLGSNTGFLDKPCWDSTNGTSWDQLFTPNGLSFFIVVAGNDYIFFGRDGTSTSQIDAMVASDPSSSFSQNGSTTRNLLTTIQSMAGFQVGNVIHLIVASETSVTAVQYTYSQYDMSLQAFVTSEIIASALNTEDSNSNPQYGCSIIVRSAGEVVVLFNGAHLTVMGSTWSRIYYSRRTATNTWAAAVEVDAAGSTNYWLPLAVLGTSDTVHFFWGILGSAGAANDFRALSSANVLQTAGATTNSKNAQTWEGLPLNVSGTIKIAVAIWAEDSGGSTQSLETLTFTSGNTPTVSTNVIISGGLALNSGVAAFNDGTDFWATYPTSAFSVISLNAAKSTDSGVTFGAGSAIYTGAVGASIALNSVNGNIYQRGSNFVIPYVVNDNGTLKYNEYTVRSSGTVNNKSIVATVTVSAALLHAVVHKKAVVATSALTAKFVRSVGKKVKATSTLTAKLLRRISKTIVGSSTITAALAKSKQKMKSIAGSSTITAVVTKHIAKAISVAVTTTVAVKLVRQIGKSVKATSTVTAKVRRSITHRVVGTSTMTVALTKHAAHLKTIVGSTALTAKLLKSISHKIVGSSTVTAALTHTRRVLKSIVGSTTITAKLRRSTTHKIVGTTLLTAKLLKSISKSIRTSSTVTAVITKIKAHTENIVAVVTVTASVQKITAHLRKIVGTTVVTARLIKSISKHIVGHTTITAVVSASLAFLRTIVGSTALTAKLVRSVGKSVKASTTMTAHVIATFVGGAVHKSIVGTSIVTARVVKSISKSVVGTSAVVAALRHAKTLLKHITATTVVSATVSATKAFIRNIVSTAIVTAKLVRSVGKPIKATSLVTVKLVRRVAHKIVGSTAITAVVLAGQMALKTVVATTIITASVSARQARRVSIRGISITTARLVRSVGKKVSAHATVTAKLMRRISKHVVGSTLLTAMLTHTKHASRVLTASTVVIATVAIKRVAHSTISASVILRAAVSRTTSKHIAGLVNLSATIIKGAPKSLVAVTSLTGLVRANKQVGLSIVATIIGLATILIDFLKGAIAPKYICRAPRINYIAKVRAQSYIAPLTFISFIARVIHANYTARAPRANDIVQD